MTEHNPDAHSIAGAGGTKPLYFRSLPQGIVPDVPNAQEAAASSRLVRESESRNLARKQAAATEKTADRIEALRTSYERQLELSQTSARKAWRMSWAALIVAVLSLAAAIVMPLVLAGG